MSENEGVSKIDAIILAGGLGTRIREVAGTLPKVLLPVDGKPFLDILLHRLSQSGKINRVTLAIGYQADKIIEHYQESRPYKFEIAFSVETELLGTGGAVKKALEYTRTEDVLVLNGDSYVDVDLEDLFQVHRAKKAAMTIVVREVSDAGRYGRVLMDSDDRVNSFEEKKAEASGGYINAGVYLLKRDLFEDVTPGKVVSLENDLLPIFLSKPVFGHISLGKFIDIGIPETYRIAGEYLKTPSPAGGEGPGVNE
jgi:D-glycero-alpha-D-manno-heptose 1-phosphate guanylyltransferase